MEILLVVVLVVIAGAAFMWMRSRDTSRGLSARGSSLRGPRRARMAARHDPMAEVVERHAMATDPHEAAEAELRLQAQANRVAANLHAEQAAALEREAGAGRGASRGDRLGYDEHGRRIYGDEWPGYAYERPGWAQERRGYITDELDEPGFLDEEGRPVYRQDRPGY